MVQTVAVGYAEIVPAVMNVVLKVNACVCQLAKTKNAALTAVGEAVDRAERECSAPRMCASTTVLAVMTA